MAMLAYKLQYLVFMSIILSITCAPISSPVAVTPIPATTSVPSVEECGFDGNPDFYGLGIRTGIYLQWATSLVANHFLNEESVKSYLETNTVFLLAVFVALAVATVDKTLRSAEVVVLLQLSFGFLFSILSIWGYRTRSTFKGPIRFPLMGSFFRLSLTAAICAYSIWFWFTGLHLIDDKSCPSYIFLFAKADIRGGIRVLFEIQSVLILTTYGVLFLQEFLLIFAFTFDTALIGLSVTILSLFFYKSNAELSRLDFWNLMIKQGVRITVVMVWSWANGKGTSGSNRPHLLLPLIVFINCWIFVLRSVLQFICLFIFKRSPPMGFPPLIPISGNSSNSSLDKPQRHIRSLDRFLQ